MDLAIIIPLIATGFAAVVGLLLQINKKIGEYDARLTQNDIDHAQLAKQVAALSRGQVEIIRRLDRLDSHSTPPHTRHSDDIPTAGI